MNKTLEELRKEIDNVDDMLIALLAKRMDIVKKIGNVKKELGLEIVDAQRWQKIVEKTQKRAEEHNIGVSFINRIYELIHEHAQELEKK